MQPFFFGEATLRKIQEIESKAREAARVNKGFVMEFPDLAFDQEDYADMFVPELDKDEEMKDDGGKGLQPIAEETEEEEEDEEEEEE